MSYEAKAGQFNLFKNNKKQNEKQPDFKGDGMDLSGTEILIAAWQKKTKNGDTYFSVKLSKKSDFVKSGENESAPF